MVQEYDRLRPVRDLLMTTHAGPEFKGPVDGQPVGEKIDISNSVTAPGRTENEVEDPNVAVGLGLGIIYDRENGAHSDPNGFAGPFEISASAPFTDHSDLQAAAYISVIHPESDNRHPLERKRRVPRCLVASSGFRTAGIWCRAGSHCVLGWSGRSVWGNPCLLFASLRRHPSSTVGFRSRLRVAVNLHFWMVRRCSERRPYSCSVDP
jgi:hypothetical protein